MDFMNFKKLSQKAKALFNQSQSRNKIKDKIKGLPNRLSQSYLIVLSFAKILRQNNAQQN